MPCRVRIPGVSVFAQVSLFSKATNAIVGALPSGSHPVLVTAWRPVTSASNDVANSRDKAGSGIMLLNFPSCRTISQIASFFNNYLEPGTQLLQHSELRQGLKVFTRCNPCTGVKNLKIGKLSHLSPRPQAYKGSCPRRINDFGK